MGALFAGILIVAALPAPPTDDGYGCQSWAVDAASALIANPQPVATGLDGETSGGLSQIPDEVWAEIRTLGSPSGTDGGGSSWRAVKEGLVPVDSVPQIATALQRTKDSVRRVLQASLGPANVLPEQWQVWCTIKDCPGHPPVDGPRVGFPVLGLAFGWRALEEGRLEDAVLACTGVAGFLRALAGTGLIGQLLDGSNVRGLSLLCLETASRVDRAAAQRLAAALSTVEREWPRFSHTLRQELVFGQLYDVDRLPPQLRARVPPRWLAHGPVSPRETTWGNRLRGTLFGAWAMRELCLQMAGLIEVADANPVTADPRFRAAGEPTLLEHLVTDLQGASDWLRFVRRIRRLTTEIRMLNVGLGTLVAAPSRALDARTARPLQIRTAGGNRSVVAVADPAFGAEELHLPIPEGTPTRP